MQIGTFRPPQVPVPIRHLRLWPESQWFRGRRAEVEAALFALARQWPGPISALDAVCVVRRRFPEGAYAESRVYDGVAVVAEIHLSRRPWSSPGLEETLSLAASGGWSHSSTIGELIAHEFAHAVANVPVVASAPKLVRAQGLAAAPLHQDMINDALRLSGFACVGDVQAEFPMQAQCDTVELLAEAFVDRLVSGPAAHPFSHAVWRVMADVWGQKPPR